MPDVSRSRRNRSIWAGAGALLLLLVGGGIWLGLSPARPPDSLLDATQPPGSAVDPASATPAPRLPTATPASSAPDSPLGTTPPGSATAPPSATPAPRPPTATPAPPASPSPVATRSATFAVFAGITPCDDLPRPLPQIPVDTACEQMIGDLTLYQDPQTGTPTTYQLHAAYGLPQQNTQGLVGGGTKLALAGNWTITHGTSTNPNALVYQLNPDNPQTAVAFLKADDNILLLLDRATNLMVGNAAWSYTLNRTDRAPQAPAAPGPAVPAPVTPPPSLPMGAFTPGVFEGRTPCDAITLAFTGFPAADCQRIKWRLTLYQDPATGAPSIYKFQGTQTTREGTWTIERGTKTDPAAVVYRFDLDPPHPPAFFLQADDNLLLLLDHDRTLLVGDALMSYTLSRVDKDMR